MEAWKDYTTKTFDNVDYLFNYLGLGYFTIGMESSFLLSIPKAENYKEDFEIDSHIFGIDGSTFLHVEIEVAKSMSNYKGKKTFSVPKEIWQHHGRQILTKVSKYLKYREMDKPSVKIRFSTCGDFAEIVFFSTYDDCYKCKNIIPYQTKGRNDILKLFGVNCCCGYFIKTLDLGKFFDFYYMFGSVDQSLLLDWTDLSKPLN